VLSENIDKRLPVGEGLQALRDVPMNLPASVQDEPPEAAPAPQNRHLRNPEQGRARLGEIQERRRSAGLHDPADLAYGPGKVRGVAQRVASRHDVDASVGEIQRAHVLPEEEDVSEAVAVPRQAQHGLRDVHPGDAPPRVALRQEEGDVPGAAPDVDAGRRRDPRQRAHQVRLPGGVAEERHRARGRVVLRRRLGEVELVVAPLPLGSPEPVPGLEVEPGLHASASSPSPAPPSDGRGISGYPPPAFPRRYLHMPPPSRARKAASYAARDRAR
jgi:hypothetical protein